MREMPEGGGEEEKILGLSLGAVSGEVIGKVTAAQAALSNLSYIAKVSGMEIAELTRLIRLLTGELTVGEERVKGLGREFREAFLNVAKDARVEYDRMTTAMRGFGEVFGLVESVVDRFGKSLFEAFRKSGEGIKILGRGKEEIREVERLMSEPGMGMVLERTKEMGIVGRKTGEELERTFEKLGKEIKSSMKEVGRAFQETMLSFTPVAIIIAGLFKGLEVESAGWRVVQVLEGVRERAWRVIGDIREVGFKVVEVGLRWQVGVEEAIRIGQGLFRAMGVQLRGIGGKRFVEILGDYMEKVLVMSKRTGLGIEEIMKSIGEFGKAMGRLSVDEGDKVLRFFEMMGSVARGTRLSVEEFKGVMDMTRGALGLFGWSVEGNVKNVLLFRQVLDELGKTGEVALSPLAAEKVWSGVMGFERRLLSNVGSLLFFTGKLREPLEGPEDLWGRMVGAVREYGKEPLSLIRRYIETLRGAGIEGGRAKLAVFTEMGLSPEFAPVFDRIYKVLEKMSSEQYEAVVKYIKTGEMPKREDLKELFGKEFIADYRKLYEGMTPPLQRIRNLVEEFFSVVFPRFAMAVVSLLAAVVKGVTFDFEGAGRLLSYGVEQFGMGFRGLGEIVRTAGRITGDVFNIREFLEVIEGKKFKEVGIEGLKKFVAELKGREKEELLKIKSEEELTERVFELMREKGLLFVRNDEDGHVVVTKKGNNIYVDVKRFAFDISVLREMLNGND